MDLRDLLPRAVECAQIAGRSTLAHFNNPHHHAVAAEYKGDDTPVTVADRHAETLVRDYLARHFPTHGVAGEEHPDTAGSDPDHRWIVDPIDGTKSFIHGVPLYGVLIGYLHKNVVKAGVIHLPALNETVYAAEGLGCYLNGAPARCSDVTKIEDATVVAGSVTRALDRSDAYRDLADRARLNRGWGDAFGYALVATGRADVMLDPKIAPWDCSPMPVIMAEAGGWSGNWDGRQDIHGPDWLATCAGLKDEVLATLAKHPARPDWPHPT